MVVDEQVVFRLVLGSVKVKSMLDEWKLKLEIDIGLRLEVLGVLAGAGAEKTRGRMGRRRETVWSIVMIV